MNDYKISQYHSIKSGIILYGAEAYVFTQISNNDINSHITVLLRGKEFRNAITLPNAMKLLLNYVRINDYCIIIPSIQRKNRPGNRNLSNSVYIFNKLYIWANANIQNMDNTNLETKGLLVMTQMLR